MSVKCLNKHQKKYIVYLYINKMMNIKELAETYYVSPRTINRVLVEAGVATTVARIKGEAYQVMQLLKKYGYTADSLEHLLEEMAGVHA